MRFTGHVDKLNWDRLTMRSATISVVGASCVSLVLVFGSYTAAQNSSESATIALMRTHSSL
jgi:hypothetical protein